jgi:hypothetical protein
VPEELEELLRRSLRTEAERIEPAGDGLRRIRERTSRRWGWSHWRMPALALAATAAVVAAVVAAPSVLPSLTRPPAGQPAGGRTTSPGRALIPGAGVYDLPTVWPYPSRADGFRRAAADQGAGTYGDLTKPDQLALRFVGSYLSPRGLDAVSLGGYLAGLRMQVSRDGHPITLVYLVRVRVGDDAPYVVAGAEAADLTVDPVPAPSGGVLTARGTVTTGTAPTVQLRVPGGDLVLSETTATVRGTAWSAQLSRPDATRAAAVTAWTAGPNGVTAFVSRSLG